MTDFPAETMVRIGDAFRESQDRRLANALDVRDNPAPPLKRVQRSNFTYSKDGSRVKLFRIQPDYKRKGYADYKVSKFHAQPVRDWFLTGLTRRSIKVLSARPNQVKIGPTNELADQRITWNQRRWRQYGVSPNDARAIAQAAHDVQFIKVEKAS